VRRSREPFFPACRAATSGVVAMPAFARIRTAPAVAEIRRGPSHAPLSLAAPAGRTDATRAGGSTSSEAVAAINLVIATPCFGGQISVLYAASLFKLQKLLRAYGTVNLKLIFKDGDALITRARASLVSQFLDDPGATHLLFIDADVGFEPEQVLRLLQCGAEMCAAVYPVKRIDWDKVKQTIDSARPNPAAASLQYVFEVEDRSAVIAKAGFVKVRYAGTGFLMIRRGALEKMCAQYPQLQYKRDHSTDAAIASDKRFALFECMIAEDGTYLSEDFAFCKRWTDMGGEIWADLDSRLSHTGPMTFHGDLSSQFAGAGG
jgi:hypothetical protein